MKALLVTSLLFSATAFAQQTVDLRTVKSLMTQRKATLEYVYPGMSKKLVTLTKYPTEIGPCEVTETSVQTILKLEGDNMIIHSKESFVPARTSACEGFESQDVAVIFFEVKPTLAMDLADLDAIDSNIKALSKSGEILTMILDGEEDRVTVKYDLTKPSFKNLIYTQDSTQTMTGSDLADISPSSINLSNVLFCESAESENCSAGDYSDILF